MSDVTTRARTPRQQESGAEAVKRESRGLRGTISSALAGDRDHFEESDKLVLKFHGIYQQDDRDERGGEDGKSYSFMVRVAAPGGALTAEQYLELDRLASEHGNGTLRLTTRQGVQFHGVIKRNLRRTVGGIHASLLSTLAACGDVRRNVMACPAPHDDAAHREVQALAGEIARDLAPRTGAYHEIWVDGERAELPSGATDPGPDPFYGEQYLPRKFKIAVALDSDNCVDVFADDCGLIAVTGGGSVLAYDLLVGGGLGLTHNKADTFARLGTVIGSVAPEHAVEAVRTVAAIFRDHGNRADRRHARIKYLLEDWGVERFRIELESRVSWRLGPALARLQPVAHDHLGLHEQGDGRFFYGVFVENGRILDGEGKSLRSGLRTAIARHRPGIRLTPAQGVLLTDLDAAGVAGVLAILDEHGVERIGDLSAVKRYSMACPALPTCGLALTDAERVLPAVVERLEQELARLGAGDTPLTVRMTGCPNGCARPYNADIAFVGRRPGVYHVLVGGRLAGDRLADLFAADVPIEQFVEVLQPLFERYAGERLGGEALGDFYQRATQGQRLQASRHLYTGKEAPTRDLLAVRV